MRVPPKPRYTLRYPDMLRRAMRHPGRGTPYSTRTLADAAAAAAGVKCHSSLIQRLLDGSQNTCEMDVAHGIAEAVGAAVLLLFAPSPSPETNDSATDPNHPPKE